jgi:phage/plasmid-associated DNA primase
LLSYTGRDAVTVNRKNEKKWHGVLGIKFLLMSNPILKFTDASGVIAERFVPFDFDVSFFGREDTRQRDKLEMELPGILNRVLEAGLRFRARGKFKLPTSSQIIIDQMVGAAAPIRGFIDECCSIGPKQECARDGLYHLYTEWCEQGGMKHLNKENFVTALRDFDGDIQKVRPRDPDNLSKRLPFKLIGIAPYQEPKTEAKRVTPDHLRVPSSIGGTGPERGPKVGIGV